jgi:DnaJ family protein C protein 28
MREAVDGNSVESWIDRTIREAQERGLFDNLRGAGRPINWEDESLVDEEWLMAFRIMREHGFAPEWIELHKEIGAELKTAREAVLCAWQWRQERLEGAREQQRRSIDAEWRRAREAFAEVIAELNAKIADFNLMVPVAQLQRFKLDLAEELAGLGIDAL